jgi:hypothetical protein
VYELTQSNLKLLESFSTEEKLNFPLLAFEQDTLSIEGEMENDLQFVERQAIESRQVDDVALETRSND